MNLIRQYNKERKEWKQAGKPLRSDDRIQELYSICSSCPMFEKGKGYVPGYDRCGICGCQLHPSAKKLNKLSWATTQCPANPPLWTSDDTNKNGQGETCPIS